MINHRLAALRSFDIYQFDIFSLLVFGPMIILSSACESLCLLILFISSLVSTVCIAMCTCHRRARCIAINLFLSSLRVRSTRAYCPALACSQCVAHLNFAARITSCVIRICGVCRWTPTKKQKSKWKQFDDNEKLIPKISQQTTTHDDHSFSYNSQVALSLRANYLYSDGKREKERNSFSVFNFRNEAKKTTKFSHVPMASESIFSTSKRYAQNCEIKTTKNNNKSIRSMMRWTLR